MAYTQFRPLKDGSPRYAGFAKQLDGTYKQIGTFDTEERAMQVAEEAEAFIRGNPELDVAPEVRATITIAEYVPVFLRLHDVEPNTIDGYRYTLMHWLVPILGTLRVSEVEKSHLRRLFVGLKDQGVSAQTRSHLRTACSAMFRMAWVDGYRDDNPIPGLPPIKIPPKPKKVWTMAQFNRVWPHAPNEPFQMFLRLMAGTGMRMGEISSLLVQDWHSPTQLVAVGKSLTSVTKKERADKRRFIVREYTKNATHRRVQIGKTLAQLLDAYIEKHKLKAEDLLFPAYLVTPASVAYAYEKISEKKMAKARRIFAKASNGRWYPHGSVNCYEIAKCRCRACRQARTAYSAAKRVEKGKGTRPGANSRDGELYVSKDGLRRMWLATCAAGDPPFAMPLMNLRHVHANELLRRGGPWTPDVIAARLGNSEPVLRRHYLCYPDEHDADMLGVLDELDGL